MKQIAVNSIVLAAVLSVTAAMAADPVKNFPTKPVRIIVGYAAGGGVDMAARLVGRRSANCGTRAW